MINQGISDSILGFLSSRNNDINGYWGIGILCKYCVDGKRKKCGVNLKNADIKTGNDLKISSFIINEGIETILRILKNREIEKIQISLKYQKSNSNMCNYTDWFECNLSVLVIGNGNFGFSNKKIMCWPHNASRERRRNIG